MTFSLCLRRHLIGLPLHKKDTADCERIVLSLSDTCLPFKRAVCRRPLFVNLKFCSSRAALRSYAEQPVNPAEPDCWLKGNFYKLSFITFSPAMDGRTCGAA